MLNENKHNKVFILKVSRSEHYPNVTALIIVIIHTNTHIHRHIQHTHTHNQCINHSTTISYTFSITIGVTRIKILPTKIYED